MHTYICTHIDIILLHTLYTASLLWISVRNNYIFLSVSEWKNSRHKKQLLHSHFVCWAYWINEADPLSAALALLAHFSCSAERGPTHLVCTGQAAHCKCGTASLPRAASHTLTQDSTQTEFRTAFQWKKCFKLWFQNTFLFQ